MTSSIETDQPSRRRNRSQAPAPDAYIIDGALLRKLRQKHGLSQEALAWNAGVSLSTLATLDAATIPAAAAGPSPAWPPPLTRTSTPSSSSPSATAIVNAPRPPQPTTPARYSPVRLHRSRGRQRLPTRARHKHERSPSRSDILAMLVGNELGRPTLPVGGILRGLG